MDVYRRRARRVGDAVFEIVLQQFPFERHYGGLQGLRRSHRLASGAVPLDERVYGALDLLAQG